MTHNASRMIQGRGNTRVARATLLTGVLAIALLLSLVPQATADDRAAGAAASHEYFQTSRPWHHSDRGARRDRLEIRSAVRRLEAGRHTFRFDTLGNEAFWGDTLRIQEPLATLGLETLMGVGLKIDASALSRKQRRAFRRGAVSLQDPSVTVDLLERDAVIGIKGFFDRRGQLSSVGVQCSLCHSVVDNSVAPNVGVRLDGWANRDMNIGAIINLAPNLDPFVSLLGVSEETVRFVLNSWGPGRFDSALLFDGKAFRPDGGSGSVLIPPVFGLAGINLHTWTGWGGVAHWAALVSSLELMGQGTFIDPRLNDAEQFPIAAANGFGEVRSDPDLVTAKLPDLHNYILSLRAPRAPRGSFNRAAAARGKKVFDDNGRCAQCHVPPLFTEPGWNLHTPEEIGIDAFIANRSPERAYRTAPLKGLRTHAKGGFFHDGRFATLLEVIEHYDVTFDLALGAQDKRDLEQYLKSL